jgi:hypothetical protein
MRGKLLTTTILSVGLSLIATVYVYAVENLILNGDFEEGPGGWGVAARGAANMIYEIDDEESISGKQSAMFEVLDTGAGGMHDLTLDCDTPIRMKGGNDYTVDFWVKAEEERTIAIDLLMNHDPWTNVFRIENIPVTTEWQVWYHTFEADFTDENMVFLFSFSRASNMNPKVVMWIDNVRFYEGEFEEEDLLDKPKAVAPADKLAGSWGLIKSDRVSR